MHQALVIKELSTNKRAITEKIIEKFNIQKQLKRAVAKR